MPNQYDLCADTFSGLAMLLGVTAWEETAYGTTSVDHVHFTVVRPEPGA